MSPASSKSPVREIRWVDKAAVVHVSGDVDLSRSSDFQQSLLAVMDRKPERVVIDLSGVPYMDSSGVASLVKLLSRTRKAGAQLCLVALQQRVRSIFEITRLDTVFDLYDTVDEALE
jgi:anti-sigma B factor antagonist